MAYNNGFSFSYKCKAEIFSIKQWLVSVFEQNFVQSKSNCVIKTINSLILKIETMNVFGNFFFTSTDSCVTSNDSRKDLPAT